jgi:hypothetical protein
MVEQGPGWLYSLCGIRQRYPLLREPLTERHGPLTDSTFRKIVVRAGDSAQLGVQVLTWVLQPMSPIFRLSLG